MFLASNLKKPEENQCFCPIIALGVLSAILGTILRGILYIHKLPIHRKAADTCKLIITRAKINVLASGISLDRRKIENLS